MAATLPPGLGNDAQATQATAFIRQQPWYLDWLQTQGVTPGADQQVTLDETQRAQLMALAIQHGIGFNGKYDMIDENGQIAEEHHKLKKVAIAAALAGIAVTGLGATGIGPLAGALGGGASAAGGAGAATAATTSSVLPSTVIGSGFVPAIAGGTGLASLAPVAAGGAAAALSTGSKIASLVSGIGKIGQTLDPASADAPGSTSTRGSSYAAEASQLAANRAAAARIDQAGPSADAQAFRNQMRAALVAKMDPNAVPTSINGNALPSLANSDTVSAAAKLRDTLAARIAAGKTATTFGVSDPTQEELDAQAAAKDAAGVGTGLNSKLASVGDALQTGSRLAGLGLNTYHTIKGIAGLF